MGARDYVARESLRDGLQVTIRGPRPDDRARIVKAFSALDPESIRTRFFYYKKELSDAELAHIAEIDFVQEVILAASVQQDGEEILIGGARYVAHDATDGTPEAEIAFTVEEDYRRHGVASCLLRHLATIARQRGIARFKAEVLRENESMLSVFENSGLPMRRERANDVVMVTLTLEEPT